MKEIKLVFDNAKAAKHFLVWLSEQGEQDYWEWMRVREEEEKGDITVLEFASVNPDGVVACKCGRLEG